MANFNLDWLFFEIYTHFRVKNMVSLEELSCVFVVILKQKVEPRKNDFFSIVWKFFVNYTLRWLIQSETM